ncbi:hypothetical protein J2S49_001571 [Arcanobacterium wilhelmae]|uniref:TadE-like protein n=1 Tax=Arcanobacterium wilhelmae TaxID=1803177 RepID=A0ABT9ND99_9ACTO|nr:hypothetical protein [Arcanobacterium wilhelmae]MDP9801495.1 hypothetical protein [Arcanobacterium wilhelmae]WFN90826.1 hypothetical protein P8A24_02925 [Arcanobacterium wilhelmae]
MATVSMMLGVTYLLLSTVLAWYVHGVARDCAAEGARVAALDGSDLSLGEQRARELVATSLGSISAVVHGEESAGVVTVSIDVEYPLPSVVGMHAEVSASANRE